MIYSNFDRSDLMTCGLTYLARQTMPLDEFEVVVVDDGSTEDYLPVLARFPELRIQWIKMDHTRHPVYEFLNPGGRPLYPPEQQELWYHTPALSHNIGMRHARGEVVCITQPEVMMREDALQKGHEAAMLHKAFVFGRPYMSTPAFREIVLPRVLERPAPEYQDLKQVAGYTHKTETSPWLYWWLSFLRKEAVEQVGGVDEQYLKGVFAEDDDFKYRIMRAGWKDLTLMQIEGIHMNHEHLGGHWDRNGRRWNEGAMVNRARWADREKRGVVANQSGIWGDPAIVSGHQIIEHGKVEIVLP